MKTFFFNLYNAIVRYLWRDAQTRDALRQAVESHQSVLEKFTCATRDAEAAIRKQEAVLSDVLKHVKFLADSERKSLERNGHTINF